MARPRQRVRLEDGLKLDVNKLVRGVFWPRGNEPLTIGIQWTSNRQGVLASALITLQKHEEDRASLKIVMIGKFEQRLDLIAEPRHFGGRQWYLRCPMTGAKCSVVWLPPGADRFSGCAGIPMIDWRRNTASSRVKSTRSSPTT